MSDEDDERRTDRKASLFWAVVLAISVALLWGGCWVWGARGRADFVESVFASGDAVVVVERRTNDEGGGGAVRLVRLEVATGSVLARVRAGDGKLLAVVDGQAWFRAPGLLESRDPRTLEITDSQEELVTRWPVLNTLADSGLGCFERATNTLRFTSSSGDHLALDLAALTLTPTPRTTCESSPLVGTTAELKLGGQTFSLRGGDTSARVEVVDGEGQALGSSGLSVKFLVTSLPLDGDLLLLRRTTTRSDGPTELVRLSVRERKERWSTPLHSGGFSPQELLLVNGCLVLADWHRVIGLDVVTGRERWRRD